MPAAGSALLVAAFGQTIAGHTVASAALRRRQPRRHAGLAQLVGRESTGEGAPGTAAGIRTRPHRFVTDNNVFRRRAFRAESVPNPAPMAQVISIEHFCESYGDRQRCHQKSCQLCHVHDAKHSANDCATALSEASLCSSETGSDSDQTAVSEEGEFSDADDTYSILFDRSKSMSDERCKKELAVAKWLIEEAATEVEPRTEAAPVEAVRIGILNAKRVAMRGRKIVLGL